MRGPVTVKLVSCWLLLVELREGQRYTTEFPRGTQKPLVPQDVFGGIRDCERCGEGGS